MLLQRIPAVLTPPSYKESAAISDSETQVGPPQNNQLTHLLQRPLSKTRYGRNRLDFLTADEQGNLSRKEYEKVVALFPLAKHPLATRILGFRERPTDLQALHLVKVFQERNVLNKVQDEP